jgi:hypothetical protein
MKRFVEPMQKSINNGHIQSRLCKWSICLKIKLPTKAVQEHAVINLTKH